MTAKQQLVKLKAGDQDAFEMFYRDTHRGVYYAAFEILKDSALAEDVTQDAYIAFFGRLHDIDPDNQPFAYLKTIAKNKALNLIKKRQKETLVDFDPERDGRKLVEYPNYDTTLLTIAERILSAEEFRLVHRIAVEGYTKTEAARLDGKPITTIVWKYNKALKKIKDCYEEEARDAE